MKLFMQIGLLFGIMVGVCACGSVTKEKLGMTKKSPDEFMVVPRAPLSLPPEYDLRPVVTPQTEDVSAAELSETEKALMVSVDSEQ